MQFGGATAPAGAFRLTKLTRFWPADPALRQIIEHGLPRRGLEPGVAAWRLRNVPNLFRGLWRIAIARALGIPHHYGALYLEVLTPDGRRVQLGLASLRVVTDAGVNFIRDAFLNTTELENMKFHGFGVGTTAEATGDTALVTELTTEYAVDNTRPTGSQASNGTGVYRTVATLSPDGAGTLAITEHGIFSQAAVAGGTLLDRSKFAAVNLTRGADSLQATYDFTTTSGG